MFSFPFYFLQFVAYYMHPELKINARDNGKAEYLVHDGDWHIELLHIKIVLFSNSNYIRYSNSFSFIFFFF